MKALIVCAVLGALCTPAPARQQAAVEEVRIRGPVQAIELPDRLRDIWPNEFDQVKGTYSLSNGKSMQLTMWGKRMYAKIDGMPRTQLVAASPTVFVGRDRQMRIRIANIEGDGAIRADVLLAMPSVADLPGEITYINLLAIR